MKKIKTMLLSLCILSVLSLSAITVFGLGIQHVSVSSGLTNSIQAGFSGGQKGSGSYGTNKTKIVRQCYVRLQEGSYDSGRKYSSYVSQTAKSYYWSPKVSKANNIFYTCYTNYGWIY